MIKLLWMCLVTQAAWMTGSHGLYHELTMHTIDPPEPLSSDSYFGFSIAHRRQTNNLIISAPKADNIGKLYSCDIDSAGWSSIKTNITREYNYDHNYWLGATVKAGSTFVVTCAPLHMQMSHSYRAPIGYGLCFKIPNNRDTAESLPQISVMDRVKGTTIFEETMDSFGWAIDVAPDNSITVGGPAMFTGRVMRYSGKFDYTKKFENIKSGKMNTVFTPLTKSGVGVSVAYNFGYSVASGYFLSTNKLVYAVGSTFGLGRVIFLNEDLNFLKELKKSEDDNRVGTMFGAVLCTAQLKGKSDLLVGAPVYARQNEYNVGAVYIYLSNLGSQKFKKKIVGFQDGSYFGSAIISAGDMDGDKKDEIVIAAPYEDDGRGAVYLYCGVDIISGKYPKPLQRFQSPTGQAFGWSLTPIQDYDNNGCNELAIGAPDSNTVVVLKCIASITAKVFAEFPDLQNRKGLRRADMNETYFVFQSCVQFTYPPQPTEITASLSIKVQLSHQNAVLVDPSNDAKYDIHIKRKLSLYCRYIGVSLPPNGNYELGIGYRITAEQTDSPLTREKFEVPRVLLSSQSVLSVRDSVWAAECKNIKSCEPTLDVTVTPSFRDGYVIGSTESETISIKVSNTGDVAYSACITVNITGAPVIITNTNTCSQDSTNDIIKCAPLQPLRTNDTWNAIELQLGMLQLTNKNERITVNVNSFSKCQKVNELKVFNKEIKMQSDYSQITIKRNIDVVNMINLTAHEVKYEGKKFEHVYTITNDGFTNFIVSSYDITLPKSKYVQYTDVILFDDDQIAIPCTNLSDEEMDSYTKRCNYEKLEKRKKIVVIISLEIIPTSLDDIIYTSNVTIYTNITIGIDSQTFKHSIETLVTLDDPSVPLWVYILALLIGLLLLIIISLILRKMGYLKRQNKKKLKKLRESVRRQTVRRSALPKELQEERRSILEQIEEVDDHHHDDVKEARCQINKIY